MDDRQIGRDHLRAVIAALGGSVCQMGSFQIGSTAILVVVDVIELLLLCFMNEWYYIRHRIK